MERAQLGVGDPDRVVGPDHPAVGTRSECCADPRPQHLGVPHGAQLGRRPAEFAAERPGDIGPDQRREGRQRAAEPPGGDPHPVHRVRGVQAHGTVQRPDAAYLLVEVGEQDLAGSGGALGRGRTERRPGHEGARQSPVAVMTAGFSWVRPACCGTAAPGA
jgi:hypothetical protein